MHEYCSLFVHLCHYFSIVPKKYYVSTGLANTNETIDNKSVDHFFDVFGCLWRNAKVFDHG